MSLIFDWDFLKELILVFVPVAATIIFSKIFLNSWQIRKEKFELRKQILTEFDKTFPKANTAMYYLYSKISDEYMDKSIFDPKNSTSFNLVYPEDDAKKTI